MTDPTMALLEYLGKFGLQLDDDLIREGVRAVIQAVIEAEVTQRIGAKPYERSPERVTQRNGYRERPYETRVGEVTLLVPKLREGSYFPSFLEPRRRAEKALLAVVHAAWHADAYVEGVSTRKVDGERHRRSLKPRRSLGPQPAAEPGAHRHRQERGEPGVSGARCAGASLPGAAVGGGLPLRVAGRHLPQSAPEPPRGEHGRGRVVPHAPSGCGRRGSARYWALRWGPARALGTTRRPFGSSSCAAWCTAGCGACSWWSATPTRG